jgi:hypothetical protein
MIGRLFGGRGPHGMLMMRSASSTRDSASVCNTCMHHMHAVIVLVKTRVRMTLRHIQCHFTYDGKQQPYLDAGLTHCLCDRVC